MLKLIQEAVARGWCTDRNSHKEMDADLAEDIAASVNEALRAPKGPAGDHGQVGWMGDIGGNPYGPFDR